MKEILTIHDVRQRIDWCHDRITDINNHVLTNDNVLDAHDLDSMRLIWQYLGDLRSARWTNQIM